MARRASKRPLHRRLWLRLLPLIAVIVVAAWLWPGTEPADLQPPAETPSQIPAPPTLSLAQLRPYRPQQSSSHGFVASEACRDCHPHNHATWFASYHRRMTQVATPAAVLGNFDDVELESDGRLYRLRQRQGVCWVDMDDPEQPADSGERVEVPIVMTTGSHHMQVYWYPTFESRVVGQLPLVFLNETQQWIPRNAAFLRVPVPFGSETGRWNKTCIACHATHGQPKPNPTGQWESQVGEFGISCEACHGPGEEHVRIRRESDNPAEDPIVNPGDLSHRLASQVCGHCHSVSAPLDTQSFLLSQQEGSAFRPGDELEDSKLIVRETPESRAHLRKYIGDEVDRYMEEQYWPDGMIRISGREYNGLVESACFQEGALSCLSCHRLHQDEGDTRPVEEWANDQLQPEMLGDTACLECHDSASYGASHTHHVAGSSGSRCYNCHMPHTTYGLLKAIRSHEISSPDLRSDLPAGRPNACNLCHLDKTLAWTSDKLHQWYGAEPADLTDTQQQVASSLLWLLRGDAAQRALAAWSMGWQPAVTTSQTGWQAPFLAVLLDDPYDAVRLIAHRSLQRQPGFEDFPFNFVGPPQQRGMARGKAWEVWHQQRRRNGPTGQALLIDPDGGLQLDRLNQLLQQRDDRPINLAE